MPIRAMLVDDSAVVRGLITRALAAEPDIEVVASASDGAAGVQMARQFLPDIIVLDIEMPVMDGITALPKLLEASPKSKIIMASTLTLRNAGISLEALSLGASDYVAKPSARDPQELAHFYRELISKIKALAPAQKGTPVVAAALPSTEKAALASAAAYALQPATAQPVRALAIASSTGGPQALLAVCGGLKSQLAHLPIFITQHMPPAFTTMLAEHLRRAGERECKEAVDGEPVKPGRIYVAPGNFHMVVEKKADQAIIRLNQDPPENFCRPAADPMLRSLSAVYGAGLLTLVLTGMGSDGLEGAKIVVKNGGSVIAQDEATSVVWGMPRAVAENNLCRAVLPLSEIPAYVMRACSHAPR